MALKLADKATIGMVVSTLLLAAILGGTAWASDENTDLRYIEFATAEASRPGVTVAEYEGNWENLDAAREEWSRIRLQDPCLEWAAASFVTGSDTGRVRLIEGASRYTGRGPRLTAVLPTGTKCLSSQGSQRLRTTWAK